MPMDFFFSGKSILVTGSCGTIGSELVRQLMSVTKNAPKHVVGIDNNESALFFQDQQYLNDDRINFFVADICNPYVMNEKFSGIDVVFHCAALKHVVLCERSPEQAVQTNIVGVQNVINAAVYNNVKRVIFTSSDKAVNPTNVMGTTKLMGERLITAANSSKPVNGPVFASTRFGNVLGSSGSVIPIFIKQISKGGPITLTDKKMTRFVMSVEGAVNLVINSAVQAKGGEVFVTKMPVIRIEDLAAAMIVELAHTYGYSTADISVSIIGAKSGEKLYEELMSSEETRRAIELEDYFCVLPALRDIYSKTSYDYDNVSNELVTNPYISSDEKALDIAEITKLCKEYKLFDSSYIGRAS